MTKHGWIASGLAVGLAAVLAGGAATAALAGDGGHAGKRAARRARVQKVLSQRRQRMADFLASLNATDDQRRLVLEKARAAAPIVAGARDEARRIVAGAWASASKDGTTDRKAIRESVKAEIQALRAKIRTQIEPLARDVVTSLTPEQRQKFQDVATKRGKTLDDAKLTRFAMRLISRPMTVSYLEARLKR